MTRTINEIKCSGMVFEEFTKSVPDITGIQSATNKGPIWQHKDNLRNTTTDFKNNLCSQGLKGK